MRRLLPLQPDGGGPGLGHPEVGRLRRDPVLGLDLHRVRRRAGPDGRVRLHPDGVDGVRGEVGDGRQLVVVHELGLPPGEREVRGGRVVHLVALEATTTKKKLVKSQHLDKFVVFFFFLMWEIITCRHTVLVVC